MAYFFPAPLSDQMAYFRRSVEGLKAGGTWAGAYLNDLVIALLAVESTAARDRDEPAEVARFRMEATEALAPLSAQLRNYVEMIADDAEAAGEDSWKELCGKRSAIEILLTRYAGSPGVADVAAADVERLDEALRRVGQDQGPVTREWQVPGLPASHWWWWYPASPPPVMDLIDKALRLTEDRLARVPAGTPTHNMFGSIRTQLAFMHDTVAAGRAPTVDDKNRLTLGVIAVREFEDNDPDYCNALTEAVYQFKKL